MITRDELRAWLHLVETPGLGSATTRRLLAAFGSPQAVLGAPDAALANLLPDALLRALRAPHPPRDALPEATWRWLAEAPAGEVRDVIVLGDPRYPAALLQTADPPLLLHTRGRVELLAAASLAIVGSRAATPQGLAHARDFARHLSEQGLTIVSGLALGIDGAAHAGALAGRGSTLAFVGTGLDQTYPRSHAALTERIAREGLIASDFSLGTPPLPANFPRRNRLIAGTTRGTLVIEAAPQSGSLITARLASEAGREVFAIPGSIHSRLARGCHELIRQGAKLVESVDDVMVELGLGVPVRAVMSAPRSSPFEALPGDEDAAGPDAGLLAALGHDPVGFDALSARTGWPADRLAARLLELELEGVVQRLPGGLLQRRGRA